MTAALVIVAAAAGFAYWSRPRTIGVCVVTDYSFREQRPDWHTYLRRRFEDANRIFKGTGVRWSFQEADQPDPTGRLHGLELRRQKLIRTECAAEVILAVTGQPDSSAYGDVPAFSHTAIVVDSPKVSETRNDLVFAQALAALFGAPVDPRGAGTLMTQPPETATLPKPTARLISRLRWYDFAQGTAGLQKDWGSRVYNALVSAYSGRSRNPSRAAHQVLGLSFASDENYPAAIAHLVEVVRLDPSSADAHVELASLYTHNFQHQEAIPEYRAAVRLQPGNAANHAALATALANAGFPEEAIEEFHEALRILPKFAMAQAALAYVLSQQVGRIDEAVAAYQLALEMEPDLPAARDGLQRTLAFKERAAVLAVQRRKRVQETPTNAAAHVDLALAEARSGNVDAAVSALRRSLQLDPANGRAHADLAMLLYAQKSYAPALKEAQAAAQAGFEAPAELVRILKRKTGQ